MKQLFTQNGFCDAEVLLGHARIVMCDDTGSDSDLMEYDPEVEI
jgi:hypothetical protein